MHNLREYTETNGTYIVKKYHGCKTRNRNGTRKIIDYVRRDNVQKQPLIHTGEKQKINTNVKVSFI